MVIVNDPARPVPVNITNSALQVGAVKIDPAGNTVKLDPSIATKFNDFQLFAEGGNSATQALFGGKINATSIVIHTCGDVSGMSFSMNGTDRLTLFGGPGDVVVPLPVAIPIDRVTVQCGHNPCKVWVSIAGF